MIAKLTGIIDEEGDNFIVIDIHGVGYKVYISNHTIINIRGKREISVWTHLVVRENLLDIYGFVDKEERTFFELLIGISGIGPKSALAILSLAPVETLRKAVVSGDASYLTRVSGVGKKSAEKIVLELKDKLGKNSALDTIGLKEETETLEALRALGYTTSQAREGLKRVPPDVFGTNDRIKAALKILGNGLR